MLSDAILGNNKASILGRIASEFTYSHAVYGEGFYNFNVEVERLSEVSDILPVTVSERLINPADFQKYPEGTLVHITGQIRSYNSYVESDKKNKLVLTIFVRDIEILTESIDLSPNEIFLDGYICKTPVYRTTPFGREIADMLIAVNRSYNKSDYIPCIAWGRNARFAGSLPVGTNLRVFGRMQSRSYQKKYDNGEVVDKIAYEISVSKLES